MMKLNIYIFDNNNSAIIRNRIIMKSHSIDNKLNDILIRLLIIINISYLIIIDL